MTLHRYVISAPVEHDPDSERDRENLGVVLHFLAGMGFCDIQLVPDAEAEARRGTAQLPAARRPDRGRVPLGETDMIDGRRCGRQHPKEAQR